MKRQQEWWTPAKAPAAAPKRPGYQKKVVDTKGEYTLHTTREETAGACYRAETERVLSLKQRRQQQRRRRAEQTGHKAVGAATGVARATMPTQNTTLGWEESKAAAIETTVVEGQTEAAGPLPPLPWSSVCVDGAWTNSVFLDGAQVNKTVRGCRNRLSEAEISQLSSEEREQKLAQQESLVERMMQSTTNVLVRVARAPVSGAVGGVGKRSSH